MRTVKMSMKEGSHRTSTRRPGRPKVPASEEKTAPALLPDQIGLVPGVVSSSSSPSPRPQPHCSTVACSRLLRRSGTCFRKVWTSRVAS